MANRAYLILENGAVFEGESFGVQGDVVGECYQAVSESFIGDGYSLHC